MSHQKLQFKNFISTDNSFCPNLTHPREFIPKRRWTRWKLCRSDGGEEEVGGFG